MSLFKQLTGVITTFLVFMLITLLWFILNYNKDLIENQLNSNAKNSASFLGLAISKNVQLEDVATVEGMISSMIDNGFYEYIAVYDIDEKQIIKLSSPREEKLAHSWFSNIFEINAPSFSANIMEGWTNLGTLEVKIHQDYANNQMWNTFKTISEIFIILTILLLIILYFLIGKLLKPLKKLSIQAKAIDNNEFIIEKTLPETVEFKNVIQAMNKTILKMQSIFNKEVETLNKYNDLLYKDCDTKLGNKNYLILKLSSYLRNSHGLLTFIEIKDEISFKKKIGYKKYSSFKNFIIEQINKNFKNEKQMDLCILNDGDLAIILPNKHYEDISKRLDNLYNEIYEYINKNKLNEVFDIKLAIGTSNYVQNTSLKNILTKTDQALNYAMKNDNFKMHYLEEDIKFTKSEWIEQLQYAYENDGLIFEEQNIMDTSLNKAVMKEYYTRLKDKNDNIYTPGDFFSIVSSINWMADLEKYIIMKIFDSKVSLNGEDNSVINLSVDFVKQKKNVDWLIQELKKRFKFSNVTFYFECVNADVVYNFEEYKYFADEISQTKHNFAIESFTFDNDNFDYLKDLKPSYVKISKSYILGESKITDSILINITSAIGAYLIVKHVETKEEYESLINTGIKYLQGRYIDKLELS